MAEYLIERLSLYPWLAYAAAGAVHAALLLTMALAAAAVSIWLERKVSARIQDRLGPTRVGGRFGWLQPPADGLKLLGKEDIIPTAADGLLFRAAPYISYCTAFCVFLVLPFADGWVALRLDTAAFFFLAIAGLEIFGVILAGYASGSKYSLYGSMREAAQVISYEIPMGLCVVVPVMIAGTMDLTTIGAGQAGWFTNWYLFHDPFTFVTFWIYVTCAIAHVNRAPFDLPEAESELVAGFMTEYSGFRWVVFFMAEYASMFAVSGLAAVLFLGGWNGPLPITQWLGLSYDVHPLAGYAGNLLGMCNFIFKCFAGVVCMIWIRWTLPRLRIDQVMTMCLKYCIPLVAAMFVGAMLCLYLFPDGILRFFFPRESHAEAAESVAVATPSQEELQIENCRLKIENCRRRAGDFGQHSLCNSQSAILNLQFSICSLPFSAVPPSPAVQGAP